MAPKIRGMQELQSKLKRLESGMQARVLKNALTAGALPIQNEAKILAPYETGTLRRSIHTEIVTHGDDRIVAEIGTDVDYAPHQEFGTRKMAAHPFLRPAFDTKLPEAKAEIVSAVKSQIDHITKS